MLFNRSALECRRQVSRGREACLEAGQIMIGLGLPSFGDFADRQSASAIGIDIILSSQLLCHSSFTSLYSFFICFAFLY